MSDINVPSNNTSENEIIIVHWRGRSIHRLIITRVRRQTIANFPTWSNVIPNEGMILVSITTIGYDDTLSYFSFLFPININIYQLQFQRLLRNDLSRGRLRTFHEIVTHIERQHGQVLILI